MQVVRHVIDEVSKSLMHGLVLHLLVIIQDDDELFLRGFHVIDQGDPYRRARLRSGGLQHLQDQRTYVAIDALEGGKEIAQKLSDIIIAAIQGKPADRFAAAVDPLAEQSGLSVAGRCRPGLISASAAIQLLQQAGASHVFLVRWRMQAV
jgi:hypothetical protein